MTVITKQQFLDFAIKNIDKLEDLGFFVDDENERWDEFLGLATACTTKFAQFMTEAGLRIVDDTVFIDHSNTLDIIDDEAVKISEEYDNIPDPMPTWEKYDLSGDDDVDYNGSHIMIVTDILRMMIAAQ
jgi:hypothetical protein